LDEVTISRQEWDAVLHRLALLEAQAQPSAPSPPPVPEAGQPEVAPSGTVTRRRALLGLAGAAGAGVVAAGATAAPAAAANGDALVVGSSANTSTASTVHTVTGSGTFYGLAAVDNALPTGATFSAILGSANGQSFTTAVRAVATGTAAGVKSTATGGTAVDATSTSGTAITAQSPVAGLRATATGADATGVWATGGARGVLASGRDALQLFGTSLQPPPLRSGLNFAGAVAIDGMLDIWYCTTGGTPGIWRKLAGPTTAGSLHLLNAPFRVYDSRAGSLPAEGTKTPFAPGTTRVFDLKVNGSSVPAGATGALVTILLVNAANVAGNLTIWAAGMAKPQSNTMVWGGSAGRFTATAVTALADQARCQVNASAKTDLVLDVVGYYR